MLHQSARCCHERRAQSGYRRVYTQFVFHVQLQVTDKNVDRFVRNIVMEGLRLYRISSSDDPEARFVGNNGSINLMDVVVFMGLKAEDREIATEQRHSGETFVRFERSFDNSFEIRFFSLNQR
jgi:hypothetical protein